MITKNSFLSLVLFCSLCFTAASEEQTFKNITLEIDQNLIDLMVKNGTDVEKIHYVSFIIDCNSESLIKEFASEANKLDYEEGYISFSERIRLWTTSYAKEMKLNTAELAKHREPLTKLLPKQGCKPITWGSSVE